MALTAELSVQPCGDFRQAQGAVQQPLASEIADGTIAHDQFDGGHESVCVLKRVRKRRFLHLHRARLA